VRLKNILRQCDYVYRMRVVNDSDQLQIN